MSPINKQKFSKLLLNITNSLTTCASLEETLTRLIEITTTTINADRGTIFINDPHSGELYSRIAEGNYKREIRMLNTKGIAGWSFTNDTPIIIKNAAKDKRFNKKIDEQTGYITRNMICCPIHSLTGEKIGVAQILNKHKGSFTKHDLDLLSEMTQQAAATLQHNIMIEQLDDAKSKSLNF